MTKKYKVITAISVFISVAMFLGCGGGKPTTPPTENTGSASMFPPVKNLCPLSQATFNGWFSNGTASPNGLVLPPNSVAFAPNSNCSFYQWSEQMFLWLTSPVPGGKTVIESNMFYTVQPDSSVNFRQLRTLTRNGSSPIKAFSFIHQAGPNRLPMIKDNHGRFFEVEDNEPAAAPARMMAKDAKGKETEIETIEKGANGLHLFKDKAGKEIDHPKLKFTHNLSEGHFVKRISKNGQTAFVDPDGNEVQSEAGQATGDALMAQNGSLVYYVLFVNDVYAYYQAAAKKGLVDSNRFPTTAAELSKIVALAAANKDTLVDSNALAMELKTSWVEAASLPNAGNYVTITAIIPVYDTSHKDHWIPIGEKTTKLALVGMHVVGSAAGHPEMLWSTFEHKNNTPDTSYQYIDTNGKVQVDTLKAGGNWLFTNNAVDPVHNVSHMTTKGDTIIAQNGSPISPSNTLRTMPWGTAFDSMAGPGTTSAQSNSEVISLNQNVMKMLAPTDVRSNYLQIGTTWTDGSGPTGKSYSSVDTGKGVAVGTNVLANSTMETYFESPVQSCFTCHSRKGTLSPDQLSHIFKFIVPIKLAPVPSALK